MPSSDAGRSSTADLARAADAIAARGCGLGLPLEVLDETTSTNDVAKRAARDGAPHGATWIADVQTAGRGRQGRVWTAPRGEALLVSVLVRVSCPPARLPPLSLVAGLAARDAVARAVGGNTRVEVKWPNDVLVDGKKAAGVLVEAVISGQRVDALIIGVGVNVHTRVFPAELAEVATSIALHTANTANAVPAAPDRVSVLVDLLEGLDRDLELTASRGLALVHARLAAVDALRGARVQGEGATGDGVAEGIDLDGRLLVRHDDGTLARWAAGEVRVTRRT